MEAQSAEVTKILSELELCSVQPDYYTIMKENGLITEVTEEEPKRLKNATEQCGIIQTTIHLMLWTKSSKSRSSKTPLLFAVIYVLGIEFLLPLRRFPPQTVIHCRFPNFLLVVFPRFDNFSSTIFVSFPIGTVFSESFFSPISFASKL
jgi:hypothetical protein